MRILEQDPEKWVAVFGKDHALALGRGLTSHRHLSILADSISFDAPGSS
jgi:hypothetical protein